MTVAVVDLGCYTHPAYPEDESTYRLIERFEPDEYWGFDPHPGMVMRTEQIGSCAAWFTSGAMATYDGEIAYDPRPDRPLAAATGSGPMVVPCKDLDRWLRDAGGRKVILKMDVEGAEYDLLDHMLAHGTDKEIERLIVEWHSPPIGPEDWAARKTKLLASLRCPVEEW